MFIFAVLINKAHTKVNNEKDKNNPLVHRNS